MVACVSLLAACSDKAPAPVAAPIPVATPAPAPAAVKPAPAVTAQADDAILMKAIFGDRYRPDTEDALAEMPDRDDRASKGRYVVSASDSTVLPTGETVLTTNGKFMDDDDVVYASNGEGGLLSVFFMRQQEGKWQVVKRHENIATIGSNGQFSGAKFPMLGKNKPGLAVFGFHMTQGISVETLTLFDLTDQGARRVTEQEIRVASDNEGDCDEKLAMECWKVDSTWRMVPATVPGDYDDMLMEFSGQISIAPGERKEEPTGPRVVEKINSKARYAYDGKSYKLVEGKNQVRLP